jgi:hypothetical protein
MMQYKEICPTVDLNEMEVMGENYQWNSKLKNEGNRSLKEEFYL